MANQLVLVGNRVVAHGQDCFSTIPGAVVCLTNGKIYVGATITECSTECPADIDAVGYEYHAGVFVPCAPYGKGKGTGYFMEICPDCATPRNSGLLINDINWGKVASVTGSVQGATSSIIQRNYSFSVSDSELAKYSSLRYKIKAGSVLNIGRIAGQTSFTFIQVGNIALYNISNITEIQDGVLQFKEDIVIPYYLFNASRLSSQSPFSGDPIVSNKWVSADGITVGPLSIYVSVPGGYNTNSGWVYSSANFVIDLEGRK